MTGLRRSEAPTRAKAPIVSYDIGKGLVKVNPLATWTDLDVEGYARDRDLPLHPLREQGYAVDRLLAVHPARRRRRALPRRPLGRHRQDRVRPPRLS